MYTARNAKSMDGWGSFLTEEMPVIEVSYMNDFGLFQTKSTVRDRQTSYYSSVRITEEVEFDTEFWTLLDQVNCP